MTTGLDATLYRFYDPELDRWLSRDPIGLRGGINLYRYVRNNPVRWKDRLGLYEEEIEPELPEPMEEWFEGMREDPFDPETMPTQEEIARRSIEEQLEKQEDEQEEKEEREREKCPEKGSPKPTPNFIKPTNLPSMPPPDISLPPGWRIRRMPPTSQYPDGYWKMEKPMKDGSWQPIDPSTMKPGNRQQTHVPFPPGG